MNRKLPNKDSSKQDSIQDIQDHYRELAVEELAVVTGGGSQRVFRPRDFPGTRMVFVDPIDE